jgi:phosphatidylglycerophosphate synthase
MGFWSGYRSALKPLDIEEPIDVYVHRPFGYVIAKLLFGTPITPNQLTVTAILLGVGGGALLAIELPYHLQIGALCLFLSTAFDCADGMLARMRKASSVIGRMLDGMADLITIAAAVLGSLGVLIALYWPPLWQIAVVLALAVVTVATSAFHTAGYDHYKSVYMRLTIPGSGEGDDIGQASKRYEEIRRQPMSLTSRCIWTVYLYYMKAQGDWLARFDPFTTPHLAALPPHDPQRAAIYRRHARPAMRIWRTFFGVGSLMIGFTVFSAIGRPDIFLLWRLVVLNSIFHLYLKPLQRRASQRAFAEMGLTPGAAT